jgi:hypothetical protein
MVHWGNTTQMVHGGNTYHHGGVVEDAFTTTTVDDSSSELLSDDDEHHLDDAFQAIDDYLNTFSSCEATTTTTKTVGLQEKDNLNHMIGGGGTMKETNTDTTNYSPGRRDEFIALSQHRIEQHQQHQQQLLPNDALYETSKQNIDGEHSENNKNHNNHKLYYDFYSKCLIWLMIVTNVYIKFSM